MNRIDRCTPLTCPFDINAYHLRLFETYIFFGSKFLMLRAAHVHNIYKEHFVGKLVSKEAK